jgi:hypothetical protein
MSGVDGAGGARQALGAIATAPLGQAAIAILAVGLAAFALSRLTLALLDPEGAGWRRRALYLLGAAFNAALVVFVAHLLVGGETAAAEEPSRLARAMARPRGRWIMAAFGAGLLIRGVQRLVSPREDDLPARIDAAGLTPRAASWTASVGSVARAARGSLLIAAGGGLVYAAALRAPTAGPAWIGGLLACCLLALAANEWTRARYPLPGVTASPPGDQPSDGVHVSDSTGGACA